MRRIMVAAARPRSNQVFPVLIREPAMPSLIRLSEASVLGLHLMTRLAAEPGATVSVAGLAGDCGSSPAHLAKVCQRLSRRGLLKTVRGKAGGFRLAQRPERIRLVQVIEGLEGPLRADGCLLKKSRCGHAGDPACIFGPRLDRIQKDIVAYFRATRLSSLATRCRRRAPRRKP
jgi:Rrf2 family protein